MNLKKKKELLINYVKLNDIVSLNRSLSLIAIQQLMKKINKQENNIMTHMSLLNQVYDKDTNQIVEPKTLYIYYEANEKFTSDFYNTIKDYLSTHFEKKKDALITIGSRAKDFAEHQLQQTPVLSFPDKADFKEIATQSGLLANLLLTRQTINRVVFLVRSNKINDLQAVMFPVDEFSFTFSLSEDKISKWTNFNNQGFKFYDNVTNFKDNALVSYFQTTCYLLLLESSFIVFKNKLINENKILKDLEIRIKKAKMSLNRAVREAEIQEINLIHDNKK
ncbi:hypothetical protein OF377_00260 [Ureaplasma sp. ES3154-GEN]|uniref:MSC_0622 family F1-like ATPase gamma subunit n=1 Tax=Ureaplasma sp. ES3154-GEN TaxID=2984844 RepID=UPI0021E6F01F|nr:hypothetical protein [Ureaplasma sp. ES3154-GEN]MCV3743321.1 hypothetical protein [Ureaplasma sp. ES3154-GEN]